MTRTPLLVALAVALCRARRRVQLGSAAPGARLLRPPRLEAQWDRLEERSATLDQEERARDAAGAEVTREEVDVRSDVANEMSAIAGDLDDLRARCGSGAEAADPVPVDEPTGGTTNVELIRQRYEGILREQGYEPVPLTAAEVIAAGAHACDEMEQGARPEDVTPTLLDQTGPTAGAGRARRAGRVRVRLNSGPATHSRG